LAADVDDGAADEASDPEGLDSSDDEELGLDMLDEESEGKLPKSADFIELTYQSHCIYSHSTLFYRMTSKCWFSSHHRRITA